MPTNPLNTLIRNLTAVRSVPLSKSQTREMVVKAFGEMIEEVLKLPKYDFSKSGIKGEFYIKREEIIKKVDEVIKEE